MKILVTCFLYTIFRGILDDSHSNFITVFSFVKESSGERDDIISENVFSIDSNRSHIQ
jgi:hypothetical protein